MAIKTYTPTEAEVQKSGIAILKAMGWLVWRRNVGSMSGSHNGKAWFVKFGEPGMADTWGFTPDGRHCEIEFKRRGKRPTAEQTAWLRMTNRFGVSFWVDSTESLQRIASHIGRGCKVWYFDESDKFDLVEAAP